MGLSKRKLGFWGGAFSAMAKRKGGKKRKQSPAPMPPKFQDVDLKEPDSELAETPPEDPDTPVETPSKARRFFEPIDWIAGAVATFISLAVYLYTVAPDVTLEDSGELAVGSMYAGVPHPPGYPIWTIYSWLFTKLLPFSNIAWRVAVSSAVAAAISCGLITMMVTRGSALMLEGIELFKDLAGRRRAWLSAIAGTAAGLIFAFNGFVWSQAVIVEVYTLGILTFVITLILLMRWFFVPENRRYLYAAIFVFGLCFTNHQTLVLAAPGIVLLILLADRRLGRDFLFLSGAVYMLLLIYTLKDADDPTRSNPGLFILVNLIGTALMATLVAITVRMPVRSLSALVGGAYFVVALTMGYAWSVFIEKDRLESAKGVVLLWVALNTVLLIVLFAYSWLDTKRRESGLLTHWMPLLGATASFVVGISFYLYMPIASMTNPPMNWGYPRTPQGFKHAITRGQYDRIAASNFRRMFIDHTHVKLDPKRLKPLSPANSGKFNGGQVMIFLDEAVEEFSLSYLLLGVLPLSIIPMMRLKEVRWIAGLTGIFVSFTLILIYLINPTADEANRHLNKVFFTASHVFIAIGLGGGLAILGAAIFSRLGTALTNSVLGLLAGLLLWECYDTYQVFQQTHFPIIRAAAVAGLALVVAACLIAALLALKPNFKTHYAVLACLLAVFTLLPMRPALNNWADNEQRGHLFGYWYGHDMFTPPFDIHPEMERNAILFGGTDPGRFCPTYFIFCESFIDPENRRDPNFDRRDVYIITQNALADSTYLDYIRAHYSRSAQIDTRFFSEYAQRINNHAKRFLLNILLVAGMLAGLALMALSFTKCRGNIEGKEKGRWLRTGAWGGVLSAVCLLGFSGPFMSVAELADETIIALGQSTEANRRKAGVYPAREINTPSRTDNQNAFRAYLEDARKRMMANQLAPDEQVTLVYTFQCPVNPSHQFTAALGRGQIGVLAQLEQMGAAPCRQCQQQGQQTMIPLPEPRVSVGGNTAVSAINAHLAKNIFETNRDNAFYLEESFELGWMYPYMAPSGTIFKLAAHKEFEVATITPSSGVPVTNLVSGTELLVGSHPTDTQLITIRPGKFLTGTVGANQVPQSIVIQDSGKYDIAPPRTAYVTSGTNTALVDLQTEPIPETPFYRITGATVATNQFAGGAQFLKGEPLHMQFISGYSSLQNQRTDGATPLTVDGTDPGGALTQVRISPDTLLNRYVLMPPTEFTFSTPDGITFRAQVNFRRIPQHKERLPEELMQKDREFWKRYSERLIGNWVTEETSVKEICEWVDRTFIQRDLKGFKGDPAFVRDNDAQKGFSKLRCAIGGVYAWRYAMSDHNATLKARYAEEADFAYRQAFAFGAINPEVAFKYVKLLVQEGRFADAKLIVDTLAKTDPNSRFPSTLYNTIHISHEQTLIQAGLYREAAAVASNTARYFPKNSPEYTNCLIRAQSYLRQVGQVDALRRKFELAPDDSKIFLTLFSQYLARKDTNAARNTLAMFKRNHNPTNVFDLTALKHVHRALGEWQEKFEADKKLTELFPNSFSAMFDLAESQIRLDKREDAKTTLLRALEAYQKSNDEKKSDVLRHMKQSGPLQSLLEDADIKAALDGL